MLNKATEERNAREQDRIARQQGSIQVSGLRYFEASHWRDAILHFLFGIWSDDSSVAYRPKVTFGQFGFRLDPAAKQYSIWARDTTFPFHIPMPVAANMTLVTGTEQLEFEGALIRFVKNDAIRMLRIDSLDVSLDLFKGSARGDLHPFHILL